MHPDPLLTHNTTPLKSALQVQGQSHCYIVYEFHFLGYFEQVPTRCESRLCIALFSLFLDATNTSHLYQSIYLPYHCELSSNHFYLFFFFNCEDETIVREEIKVFSCMNNVDPKALSISALTGTADTATMGEIKSNGSWKTKWRV